MKNAFNSIKRSHLFEEMSHNCPDLFSHVTQMYSSSSPLVYLQEEHTVVLSEEVVHQGDPLGPVLFSARIYPLLSKLQEKYPAITLLAYLDYVLAVGEPTSVLSFLEEFRSSFKSIALQVAEHKCQIYTPSPLVCPHSCFI